ncbi:DUF4199 domain-containing protein [Spongiimicrobium sp. 3-5]|uniref:DUF4199 domain-containing protein n=1 Tax=Spongiimicrobium sp. 3-5 TaxID=3332596 RepID=UPI0039803E5F
MEENQPKTGKFSLNYGLILGALGVAFGIMLYTMDAHYTQEISNTIIGITMMVAVIVWGIFSYKKANGGFLTLSEALKLGAGIALVAAIIGVIYSLILSNFIDPDFAQKTIDYRMAEVEASGELSAEAIQQQKEMSLKFFWMGYPFYLIINIILGLIIALVTGLFMKKQKPAY